jgi:hypothetical protein
MPGVPDVTVSFAARARDGHIQFGGFEGLRRCRSPLAAGWRVGVGWSGCRYRLHDSVSAVHLDSNLIVGLST